MAHFETQGDSALKEVKKCLATGVFKWSKDYLSAASHIDQAVKFYRLASNTAKAKGALQ